MYTTTVNVITGEVVQIPYTAQEQADWDAAEAAKIAAAPALAKAQEALKAQADLAALDLKSIRAMREYIAAKPDAPAFVKQHEADALALRGKLK